MLKLRVFFKVNNTFLIKKKLNKPRKKNQLFIPFLYIDTYTNPLRGKNTLKH